MNLNTFNTVSYGLIDDWLVTRPKYRQRGSQPKVNDSELLIMEVVDAFLGRETDKRLFLHFRRDHYDLFANLCIIHCTQTMRKFVVGQSAIVGAVWNGLWLPCSPISSQSCLDTKFMALALSLVWLTIKICASG